MEPRIQYASTTDGVSIAFWTLGEGMPFVYMPGNPTTSTQSARQMPDVRRWYDRLAAERMLVRYDPRGGGLSDREVTDLSFDGRLLDLEAVADCLSLGRFVVFAYGLAGPQAIAYAARNPERVAHLVLWCTSSQPSEVVDVARLNALLGLADVDWELCTETLASDIMGWPVGEEARRGAAYLRENATPELLKAGLEAMVQVDVTDLLPHVKSPTLVMHRRGVLAPGLDGARRLASRIPHARLAVLDGKDRLPFRGDMDAVMQAIDEFLGEGEEAAAAAELPEGMAVILFADIAESTALTEKLGDAAFRAKARELDTALRGIIRECSGTPVEGKVLGDGVLAVFTSARRAIDCALRCDAASEPLGLQLHLGIHAGDVIREGNNVYGGAVNIAARIAAASAPGEVLVSDTVRGLARTSAGVAFDDRGEHQLKGVAEAQRLFAVRKGG